jgi:hypothetical protein
LLDPHLKSYTQRHRVARVPAGPTSPRENLTADGVNQERRNSDRVKKPFNSPAFPFEGRNSAPPNRHQ